MQEIEDRNPQERTWIVIKLYPLSWCVQHPGSARD